MSDKTDDFGDGWALTFDRGGRAGRGYCMMYHQSRLKKLRCSEGNSQSVNGSVNDPIQVRTQVVANMIATTLSQCFLAYFTPQCTLVLKSSLSTYSTYSRLRQTVDDVVDKATSLITCPTKRDARDLCDNLPPRRIVPADRQTFRPTFYMRIVWQLVVNRVLIASSCTADQSHVTWLIERTDSIVQPHYSAILTRFCSQNECPCH